MREVKKITVRLPPHTLAKLRHLTEELNITRSTVVREAIRESLPEELSKARPKYKKKKVLELFNYIVLPYIKEKYKPQFYSFLKETYLKEFSRLCDLVNLKAFKKWIPNAPEGLDCLVLRNFSDPSYLLKSDQS